MTQSSDGLEKAKFNVTLIGDGYVGKTSLLRAIQNSTKKGGIIDVKSGTTANLHAETTVEASFGDQKIKFILIDTAGQEEYEQIRKACFEKTSVFLLCFSVADKTSFENLMARWVPEIHSYRNVPIVLVGTKSDLQHAVPRDRGQRLQRRIGARHYVECSAANGDGVDKIVEYCAEILTSPDAKRKSNCSIQ